MTSVCVCARVTWKHKQKLPQWWLTHGLFDTSYTVCNSFKDSSCVFYVRETFGDVLHTHTCIKWVPYAERSSETEAIFSIWGHWANSARPASCCQGPRVHTSHRMRNAGPQNVLSRTTQGLRLKNKTGKKEKRAGMKTHVLRFFFLSSD